MPTHAQKDIRCRQKASAARSDPRASGPGPLATPWRGTKSGPSCGSQVGVLTQYPDMACISRRAGCDDCTAAATAMHPSTWVRWFQDSARVRNARLESAIVSARPRSGVGMDHSPNGLQRLWLVFNPPPSWPPAPKGWQPAQGWNPDPSWPPPPTGWKLWRLRPARLGFLLVLTSPAAGILSLFTISGVVGDVFGSLSGTDVEGVGRFIYGVWITTGVIFAAAIVLGIVSLFRRDREGALLIVVCLLLAPIAFVSIALGAM